MHITKDLLDFLFSGAMLRRWNGLIHPIELTEVDRQGHKMMIAWLLFMLEKPQYSTQEAVEVYGELVEGAIFSYCLNLALTDIKPSIYEQICKNEEHHKEIVLWAMEKFMPLLEAVSPAVAEKACTYMVPPFEQTKAREILKAASLYSRLWEYHLLHHANTFLHTDASISLQLSTDIEAQCERLPSFKKILPPLYTTSPQYTTALRKIASLCGTLRFQRRWAQTPRTPETSVLGHSFLVSTYSYFFSTILGSCTLRCANTFFTGIFHDLPELVTQDIVNPVKHSSPSVAKIIQEYEHQEMQKHIFLPLEDEEPEIAKALEYLLGYGIGSEFYNTIEQENTVIRVSFKDLQERYNNDIYNPKDGTLVKLCDTMSALMEVNASIASGIGPATVVDAHERIVEQIRQYTYCSFLNESTADSFKEHISPVIEPFLSKI